jgi:alkanesulfonate monooxygenase SsuD/methylene tetrahydromethanopterin reductase-like flavin-dependent oxidoreductase (luciferase family)
VDQISGGRVIFGLGAGEAMNLEPYGIEWEKPVSKLVEFVTIIRKLWSGDMINYAGQFWTLNDAFLQITPSEGKVPIYFGANGPRTLKLTGEMADGWLSIPLSPELYKKRLQVVKQGLGKANRSLDDLDTGVYLYTSISKNAEEAYNRIDKIKSQVIPSPELLREAGYDIELPEYLQSISYFKALLNDEWVQKFLAFAEFIPREAALEFSIAGTVEECIDKIESYVKVGVRHFLLLNVGPDPREVVKAYGKEIIPYFKSE